MKIYFKEKRYYFHLSCPAKLIPAVLCGKEVGKRRIVNSRPILISPLPLPLHRRWQKKLKLFEGQESPFLT